MKTAAAVPGRASRTHPLGPTTKPGLREGYFRMSSHEDRPAQTRPTDQDGDHSGHGDHGHPAQSEQEARNAGKYGWGYGGRPASEADAFAAEEAPTGPEAEKSETRTPEQSASPPASPGEESDDTAPTDLGGHHPDWRR